MLGLPKIKTDLLDRFFFCFLILSTVRKSGGENTHRFKHLRTQNYVFDSFYDII